MTRKYEIKYHFNSNWTPSRAKNFVKYMGLKSTNFDDNMNILSQKYGCTSQELQNQIDPYKYCLKVFPNDYEIFKRSTRNYYWYPVEKDIAHTLLPFDVLSKYVPSRW